MRLLDEPSILPGPQFLHWFNKGYGIGDASGHLPLGFIILKY